MEIGHSSNISSVLFLAVNVFFYYFIRIGYRWYLLTNIEVVGAHFTLL